MNHEDLRKKVRGWTQVEGYSEEYRWQALRDGEPGCRVNNIFEEHLGKTVAEPPRLPNLEPPESQGWYRMKSGGRVYIPEELRKTGDPEKDLEAYIESLGVEKSR